MLILFDKRTGEVLDNHGTNSAEPFGIEVPELADAPVLPSWPELEQLPELGDAPQEPVLADFLPGGDMTDDDVVAARSAYGEAVAAYQVEIARFAVAKQEFAAAAGRVLVETDRRAVELLRYRSQLAEYSQSEATLEERQAAAFDRIFVNTDARSVDRSTIGLLRLSDADDAALVAEVLSDSHHIDVATSSVVIDGPYPEPELTVEDEARVRLRELHAKRAAGTPFTAAEVAELPLLLLDALAL